MLVAVAVNLFAPALEDLIVTRANSHVFEATINTLALQGFQDYRVPDSSSIEEAAERTNIGV